MNLPAPIATCKDEITLIGDYLSEKLNQPVLAAFEDHLKSCPDCAAFLHTYKKTIEITRSFLCLQALKNKPRRLRFRPPPLHCGRCWRSARILHRFSRI